MPYPHSLSLLSLRAYSPADSKGIFTTNMIAQLFWLVRQMDRNSVNHDEISVINQRAILWVAVTAMQGRDQPINMLRC
jgi:hypothetical protein